MSFVSMRNQLNTFSNHNTGLPKTHRNSPCSANAVTKLSAVGEGPIWAASVALHQLSTFYLRFLVISLGGRCEIMHTYLKH